MLRKLTDEIIDLASQMPNISRGTNAGISSITETKSSFDVY